MAPVWLLLQPRGYLGGFVLFFALALGDRDLLRRIRDPAPAVKPDAGGLTGSMFPFLRDDCLRRLLGVPRARLFGDDLEADRPRVAYAAGGIRRDARRGFVALIALVTVMIVAPESIKGLKPGTIYGNGIGEFSRYSSGRSISPSPSLSGRWPSRRSCSTRSTFVRGSTVHHTGNLRMEDDNGRRRGDPPDDGTARIFHYDRAGGFLDQLLDPVRERQQLLAALSAASSISVGSINPANGSGSRSCRCCSCWLLRSGR